MPGNSTEKSETDANFFVKFLQQFDGGKKLALVAVAAGELLTGCVNAEKVTGAPHPELTPSPSPQEMIPGLDRILTSPDRNQLLKQAVADVKGRNPDAGSWILDENSETQIRTGIVADTRAGSSMKNYILSETTIKLGPSYFPEATGSIAVLFVNRAEHYISVRQKIANAPAKGKMIEDKDLFFTTLPAATDDVGIMVTMDPKIYEKMETMTSTQSGVLNRITKDTGILGGEHSFGGYQVLKKADLDDFLKKEEKIFSFTFDKGDQTGFKLSPTGVFENFRTLDPSASIV